MNISDRKQDVRMQTMPQFLSPRGAVDQLSNLVFYRTKAELLRETLCAFLAQCYEQNDSGVFVNLDPDGRLLLRVPWRKEWNDTSVPALRDTERAALRAMFALFEAQDGCDHLFEFKPPSWRIRTELEFARTLEGALRWVNTVGISDNLFKAVDYARRNAARERRNKARS